MVFPRYLPDAYYQNPIGGGQAVDLSEINNRLTSLEQKEPEVLINTNTRSRIDVGSGKFCTINFSRVGDLVVANALLIGVNVNSNTADLSFIRLPTGLENYHVDRLKRRFIFTPVPRTGVQSYIRKSGFFGDPDNVGQSNNEIWEVFVRNETDDDLSGLSTGFIMTGVAINPYDPNKV